MKKLINSVETVLNEQLQGLAKSHPNLILNTDPVYVRRTDAPISGKVALISGGGSGHEPMHAGFVGKGMLDAACPGAIFTSPTPDQMFECGLSVDIGARLIIKKKNYTGDAVSYTHLTLPTILLV